MNRRARAHAFWRGAAVVDAPPASLVIETTTRCNQQCAGCLRHWDQSPAQDMSDEVFAAAVSRPGVETAMLYGLGEPLMDPALFDRIRAARRQGLLVQISTNAVLLNESARRRLLDAKPDTVIFSLDAADAETYERVHGSADFARVVENVTAFVEAARKANGPRCVAQMVCLPENTHQRAGFIQRFAGLVGWQNVRCKTDETRPRREQDTRRTHNRACPVLFAGGLYIRADGTVLPCCHMIGTEPLGRLPADDLADLWNSERMQRLRALHGAGRINDIDECRVCSLPLPGRLVSTAALLLPQGSFRRLLPVAEKFLLR